MIEMQRLEEPLSWDKPTPQELEQLKHYAKEGFNLPLMALRNINPEAVIGSAFNNLTRLENDLWSAFDITLQNEAGQIAKLISIVNTTIYVSDFQPET